MAIRPTRTRVVAFTLVICWAAFAGAQATRPAHVYTVSQFVLQYAYDHPNQPSLDGAMKMPVELGELDGVLVSRQSGGTPLSLSIDQVTPDHPRQFAWSGIEAVCSAVVKYLNRQGLIGVYVGPDPSAIDVEVDQATGLPGPGKDLRQGNKQLRLLVRTAVVSSVRTIASGDHAPAGPRVNNPQQAWILNDSPIRANGSLLRRDALDEYIYQLNRYPGRHVDAAISAGRDTEKGEVALDYLVSQAKPWSIYAGISNTGTRQTDEWRERFGFITNELTGHDDTFSIDYTTAGFSESNALIGSYEAPLAGLRKLRWRAHGSWDEFTASDVGQAGARFKGSEETAGADLIFNFFQKRQAFVDLVAGVRYQHIHVDNSTAATVGDEDFLLPHIGLQYERNGETSSSFAAIDFEGNLAGVADTDQSQVELLGRGDVDRSWTLLTASASHSFFLEPIFNPRDFKRADFANPANSSPWAALAHEIYLSVRGQYAFDNRLIPQAQGIAGGFYTVRGYPEADASGDHIVIGTAEYRWHIPYGLRPNPNPARILGQPFRIAPQQPYGRPDWDLILRGFIDAGRTWNNDRFAFEHDETLVGTGVGVELDIKRNVRLRVDWGVALHDTQDVDAGSNRFHIEFMLLY